MTSIHGKITFAYSVMAAVVVGLSIFAFLDLLFLEKQVYEGVAVSSLSNLTLEMRREEKNLFLYGDTEALGSARRYANQARGILEQEHARLVALAGQPSQQSLTAAFGAYIDLLDDYRSGGELQVRLESRIRDLGHRIVSETDQLAIRERQVLAASISASQRNLVLSVLLIALLVIGVGRSLVRADPQRLQQVLINLMRNALDVSAPEMSIRLQASVCHTAADAFPEGAQILGDLHCDSGPRVLIEIADDGPGMDPAMLSHIFEPFFTTREPGQGMGLGLYIVQEIVREHGGCIAVASQPGQGTHFYISLQCAGNTT